MALAAAQIVDAIAAALAAAPSTLGGHVHTDRAWPFKADSSQAQVRVVVVDEEIENLTVHFPAVEKHTLQVKLEGRVSAVSALDDAMNAHAAEALTLLYPNASGAVLGGLAKAMRTARIDRDMEAHGQATQGAIDITLEVVFCTQSDDPETII